MTASSSFLRLAGQTRSYMQVAEALRREIAALDIESGGRLPSERELAQKLRISRPSIREALIVLELQGEIEIRVGSGIYLIRNTGRSDRGGREGKASKDIEAPLGHSPHEVSQMRYFLEGGVAAHAARFITGPQLKKLEATLEAMRDGLKHHPGSEDRRLVDSDREFHVVLAQTAKNRLLSRALIELFDQRYSPMTGSMRRLFEKQRMVWSDCVTEHQEIFDAVANRDPMRAQVAMQHHLTRAYTRLMEAIEEDSNGGEEA